MKVGSTLFVLFGLFVMVAGIVYGLWGHELAGTLWLTVLGVAFTYMASVMRTAAVSEHWATEDEEAAGDVPDEERIPEGKRAVFGHASAPSFTPFLVAVAIGVCVVGLVFTQWLVVIGAALGVVFLIWWFLESAPRREAERAAAAHHGHGGDGHGADSAPPAGAGR